MARKEFQTLTEQMYYILLALLRPHHGYEIMQVVSDLSGGRVEVGAGTLYALLGRFEREGFIVQVESDGRRRVYRLTKEGRKLLEEEYNRLKLLVEQGAPYLEGGFE